MNQEQIQDLVEVKTLIVDMHKRLFGNGQPGIIKEHNERLSDLEEIKAKGTGAFWVLGCLITIFGGIEAFFHLFKDALHK